MGKNKSELEKVDTLYAEIRAVLEKARSSAYRAVNLAMVQAYWQIGYLIVEHEQEGKERAEYGKALLKKVSERLSSEFGKGFDVTNLRKMRQFYLLFSKRDAARLKSGKTKRDAMRPESMEMENPTIGLILCSQKNEAVARYSVLNKSKQLFASKYMLYLPTEEELARELERERRLIENQHSNP